MNEPVKHHFLPVFFLRKWCGEDGRLTQFSKPFGDVVRAKRKHPTATGFINRLYAIDDISDRLSYEIETSFLSPVDSRAAIALNALLEKRHLTDLERTAFSQFVMTLLMRMPTEIALLKNLVSAIEERLAEGVGRMALRHVPSRYHTEIERALRDYLQGVRPRLIRHLVDVLSADKIVPVIASMHWEVIELVAGPYDLLVSDRPVIVYKQNRNGETTIALPVGPRKLFVAATKQSFLTKLQSTDPKKLAASINIDVVAGASKIVYGASDRQLAFVQNRFGTNRNPSFVAKIIADAGIDVAKTAEAIAAFEDDELRQQINASISDHERSGATKPLDLTLSARPRPITLS